MGVLDQIGQMRSQGMSDEDIVGKLQEKGVSPKAINDALNQAEIKKAVSDDEFAPPPPSSGKYSPQMPATQEVEEEYVPKQGNSQQQYAPQEYYPQQGYEEQYSQGVDTSTIMEISEQVVSDKMQKVQKQIKEIADFKAVSESKINSISERLKRMEEMFDKMQVQILEKVGSYGRGIENVQKEMEMMQDSFSKVINPLADRSAKKFPAENLPSENRGTPEDTISELEKITEAKAQKSKKPKKISR